MVNPDNFDALSNLSAALRSLGRFEEAEKCCRQILVLRPDSTEALWNLATVLGDAGRNKESLIHSERVLALKPDIAAVQSNLLMQMHYSADIAGA